MILNYIRRKFNMISNFKKVRKISFHLPRYSSLPLTFENVYADRFNSIFRGFYLLVSVDDIDIENVDKRRLITFTKVRSTERFGLGLKASDVVLSDIFEERELTEDERAIIKYLNECIENKRYEIIES